MSLQRLRLRNLGLETKSEFYSEYKTHNIYKGGISLNSWVTFFSHLYGGSISDREIVQKTQFINLSTIGHINSDKLVFIELNLQSKLKPILFRAFLR